VKYCECIVDGAARGNPGEAGCGIVIKLEKKIIKMYFYLGKQTNNYAEYMALLYCLKKLIALKQQVVRISTDSQLVANHMSGSFECKSKTLQPLYQECKELFKQFASIEIVQRPREFTKDADALANLAVDHKTDKEFEYSNF